MFVFGAIISIFGLHCIYFLGMTNIVNFVNIDNKIVRIFLSLSKS